MTVVGGPAMTWSRGKLLWNRGTLTAEPGWGKYVDRPCFPAYWEAQKLRNALAEPTAVQR